MSFGDTPDHGVDKCQTCRYLIEIHGQSNKEHIRKCGQLGEDETLPPRVTSCTMHAKRTDPTLTQMYGMAWILTLDQKKRTVGFSPPKRQPDWVESASDILTGGDDE